MPIRSNALRRDLHKIDKIVYIIEIARENELTQELDALYAALGRRVQRLVADMGDAPVSGLDPELKRDFDALLDAVGPERSGRLFTETGLAAGVAALKRQLRRKVRCDVEANTLGKNLFVRWPLVLLFVLMAVTSVSSLTLLYLKNNENPFDEIVRYFNGYERRNISFDIFSDHNNSKLFKDVYGFSAPEYNKRSGERYCMLTSDTAAIVFDSLFAGKTRCQLELESIGEGQQDATTPGEGQTVTISVNGVPVRTYKNILNKLKDSFSFDRVVGQNTIRIITSSGIPPRNVLYTAAGQRLYMKVREFLFFSE